MELSRIKKIDLREAWSHEANDFTKWLSKPDNISLLSEEIGVDINVIRTEAPVGRFNVDILAEESESEDKIIIENQLEYTDHSHLGQIITYASGVDAKYVIWIVRDVREEHRQAIDWLNENTDNNLNFFLILIELWQIDNSTPAPKFVTVSKPNDWKRVMTRRTERGGSNGIGALRLDFWTGFFEFVKESGSKLRLSGNAKPGHWLDVKRERPDCHVYFTMSRMKALTCNLCTDNSEKLFNKLHELRQEIEIDLDLVGQLEWRDQIPPGKKSFIAIRAKTDCNFEDRSSWPKYYSWLIEMGEKFTSVIFSKI
jgi:hypothetical protein